MLAEIRGRSQITIPAEIIKKLGIVEGDNTKAFKKDLKKLSPPEQRAVAQKLKILAENPFCPSHCGNMKTA